MDSIRISPEEAHARGLTGEKVIFFDSRNPTAWAEAGDKIPGSIRIPVDEVEKRLPEFDKDATIIAYCT
jgi:rhodanese-related sulfurtransferase